MSTWILLIMVWTGATDGGVHTQMVEYKTKVDCQKALTQLNDYRNSSRWNNVKGVCFQGKLKGGNNGWQ